MFPRTKYRVDKKTKQVMGPGQTSSNGNCREEYYYNTYVIYETKWSWDAPNKEAEYKNNPLGVTRIAYQYGREVKVTESWTENTCHPGVHTKDYPSQREAGPWEVINSERKLYFWGACSPGGQSLRQIYGGAAKAGVHAGTSTNLGGVHTYAPKDSSLPQKMDVSPDEPVEQRSLDSQWEMVDDRQYAEATSVFSGTDYANDDEENIYLRSSKTWDVPFKKGMVVTKETMQDALKHSGAYPADFRRITWKEAEIVKASFKPDTNNPNSLKVTYGTYYILFRYVKSGSVYYVNKETGEKITPEQYDLLMSE